MSLAIKKPAMLISAALALAGVAVWFTSHTRFPQKTSPLVATMPNNLDLAQQRETAALAAIREAFKSTDEDDAVRLFISHHLAEVDGTYWKQHLGDETPEPSRVLDIIQLRDHWGGDDELETFDFTLPDEATQYVISVRFGETGGIEEISMES